MINQEIFNIYCDESRVENPEEKYMVIGALIVPRRDKSRLVKDFNGLCAKHDFNYELKWTKTSDRFLEFYMELIDLFINEGSMQFRCIIVDKSAVNYKKFHNDDKELAFFKFYYLMLRQRLLDYKKYYISLDKKPTRDKNRARALHAYLESYILLHNRQCSVAHLQAYNSHENALLQVVDYLTGLVGYAVNTVDKNTIKYTIAKYCINKLGRNKLLSNSPLEESKFNTFIWKDLHEKSR